MRLASSWLIFVIRHFDYIFDLRFEFFFVGVFVGCVVCYRVCFTWVKLSHRMKEFLGLWPPLTRDRSAPLELQPFLDS